MENKPKASGSFISYFIGYLLSVALTMAAYIPVSRHINSAHHDYTHRSIVIFVISLAIVQLFVQMFFFLHLGREDKPRWRSMAFVLALIVVLIVVVGSLWIMNNLNYRMTPQEMNHYLEDQDGGI
jgi:cytochrome o ubiquinol oxidase operon protein cyoD